MQISGKKLRRLRLLRNFTQKELAVKSGITDAAIRNYELGSRSPNKEQLIKIAKALNCDISALINHESISHYEIMQILFDYEKDIKLIPVLDEDGSIKLISIYSNVNDFLMEWYKMKQKHYNGEISDVELEDWKLSYPMQSNRNNIEMEM